MTTHTEGSKNRWRRRILVFAIVQVVAWVLYLLAPIRNKGPLIAPSRDTSRLGISTTPTTTVTTNAAGQTIYTYEMPASSTPTTCTISLQGHDAQITFDGQTVDVTPACDSWIQSSAAGGELWQRGPASNPSAQLVQVCSLSDNGGQATAAVQDDGEQIYGQEACERLLSAGYWTEETGTMFNAGSWTGKKPVEIDFSVDSGNVVTSIKWSSWTATGAVGEGTSGIENCVPNCAEGTIKYVPTTITLSNPRGGLFTKLTETRNGHTYVMSYPNQWPLGAS